MIILTGVFGGIGKEIFHDFSKFDEVIGSI